MSEHGIIGDDFGIDLPQSKVEQADLDEEKKMARFSKTDEFKRIKDYAESRILFYQSMLPDGRPLSSVDPEQMGANWTAANLVIGEFKQLLGAYENANEVVKDAR